MKNQLHRESLWSKSRRRLTVMSVTGLEMGRRMEPALAANATPSNRRLITGTSSCPGPLFIRSGFRAASTTMDPETNTEQAAMVESMITRRKLLLSMRQRRSKEEVSTSRRPHFSNTALMTRLPNTKKDVWLKKLPSSSLDVVSIVRSSPKTAQMLPRTGMKRATQNRGISSKRLKVKTWGSRSKVLMKAGSITATMKMGGPFTAKK
mmetsp:Transcript_92526/g.220227  ORF Transcript_92526/g.220227 Transcript_92526/m.220227 type:complete len:207 (+) Transcript_92526:1092-1712(+)